MKIVGIVGRSNKNIDAAYEFECLESYFRIFSKYDDVVSIMILPPKDIIYSEIDVDKECTFNNDVLNKLDVVLDMCDGFLLPGGTTWYSHDEYIVKYAIDNNKPLLGICLGMQIISVMNSKSIREKVDTTVKNETNINHLQSGVDYVHEVEIVKDSLLYDIVGVDKLKVNSRHSYRVEDVGDLDINAVSEDGLIEAVSYPEKNFILGVQWHPESLIDEDINSKKIFDRFVSEL